MKITTITPEQKPDIQITLSWDEARVLLTTTQFVSGDPAGPRGFISKVGGSLHDIGVFCSVGEKRKDHSLRLPDTWEEALGKDTDK